MARVSEVQGPQRKGGIFVLLLLLVLGAVQFPTIVGEEEEKQPMGTLEILSELKTFKDGVVSLFEKAAENLKGAGLDKEAELVNNWNNDWLSVLGVSKGLTGLAKDYALNYLGRSAYHDHNGPLIEKIRNCGWALAGKNIDEDSFMNLVKSLLEVSKEGKKLFQEGSIKTMLLGLEEIMQTEKIVSHFKEPLMKDPRIKSAFYFLSGERVEGFSGGKEDEEL